MDFMQLFWLGFIICIALMFFQFILYAGIAIIAGIIAGIVAVWNWVKQ